MQFLKGTLDPSLRPTSAEALLTAIGAINRELELHPLLKLATQQACALTGADLVALGLVGEDGQTITLTAVQGIPGGEAGLELVSAAGLGGQILATGEALCLARFGDLAPANRPDLADYGVMGVPVFWEKKIGGLLAVGLAPPGRFQPDHFNRLTHFAQHLGLALHNARRFERERYRTARVETINVINRLIASSLDLDTLLQTAVEAIADHLHYANVALLLVDPASPETLVLRASSGIYASPEVAGYRQSIHTGIIGAAARNRRSLIVNDVQRDARYIPIPDGEEIRAELAIPIISGDHLAGVLNIETEQPFSEADGASFALIADQLGIAIDKGYRFAAAKDALDETQLLYQTSQRIGMALDVPEVIEAYLEQVAAQGRYACNVVLYEFDESEARTSIVVYGRWTPEEGLVQSDERYAYSRDALDPLLDAGQTVTIADVHHDPRVPADLRRIQAGAGRPAIALIPLMVRGRRIGSVVLSAPVVHQWHETDLQPYQATAAQLATAIDSRRQRHLLYERGQRLAVLEERQRLARDLHDSVTQLIFSITLIAQSIGPAWRRDLAEGERRINRLLELSQLALAEMRTLLAELRPAQTAPQAEAEQRAAATAMPGVVQIQRHGLPAAIRKYAADVSGDELRLMFDMDHYRPQSPEREKALYHITQEACNNIIKHAGAGQAAIRLHSDDEATYLTVIDDGRGFATPSGPVSARGAGAAGLGLMTMRERAEAIGGVVHLTSRPGQGTTVVVTLPH